MYSVTVTTTGDDDVARIMRRLKGFPARMEKRVKSAVEKERSTHKYINRSQDAERETRFQVVSDGPDGVELEAEMGVEYASYLNKSGHSRFDELMRAAVNETQSDFGEVD